MRRLGFSRSSMARRLPTPLAPNSRTIGAVVYRHDCSIAPTQHFGVMPSERVWVCSDQVVERQANLLILREKRGPASEHCECDDEANVRHHPSYRHWALTMAYTF